MPISGLVDKKAVLHLHYEILHSRKKKRIPTFCDSMDGTVNYYAKWNNPVSERQIPYDTTYKSNVINKQTKEN